MPYSHFQDLGAVKKQRVQMKVWSPSYPLPQRMENPSQLPQQVGQTL